MTQAASAYVAVAVSLNWRLKLPRAIFTGQTPIQSNTRLIPVAPLIVDMEGGDTEGVRDVSLTGAFRNTYEGVAPIL